MKTYIQKVDGQIVNRQQVVEQFLVWLDSEKDGCLEWSGRRAVNPKSNQQVRMIFGLMINETIAQCNDMGIDVSEFLKYLVNDIPKGQGITKDFLHELMYVVCPTTDEDGRRVTLSKMSTQQAAQLFEAFRAIVAPLGIVLETHDESDLSPSR